MSALPGDLRGRLRARTAPIVAGLRGEEGMAMAVVLIVMMVVGLITASALSVATQTNGSTRRDANKKNALEAAEAGLQIATYRLNMLRPDDSHCVGDAVGSPDSSGTCASSTYSLGNGASYNYYTTPVLGPTGSCVGLSVAGATDISQRCITAVGSSNGVTARSQIRVAAFGAIPLFQYGITGINGVTNGNNKTTVVGTEATNKTINNSAGGTITNGVILGPGGIYQGPTVLQQRLSNPIVLGPVDPGTSNQSSLANCPARAAAGYTACNDDGRIGNCVSTTPMPPNTDPCSGFSFTAATRTLATTVNNGASLTLTGGIYNFCELDIKNNATITIPNGVRVEIFIDSPAPDDPNSGCPAGTGNFNIKNNVTWVNYNNDPTALQVYVFGASNGTNVVNWKNNGTFEGVLYAPQSQINLSHNSNNSDMIGAVSGSTVNVPNNYSFSWDPRAGTLQARSTGVYYRAAWAQCVPSYSASSPGSGCG